MDVLVSYCAHPVANRSTLGVLDAGTLTLRPIPGVFGAGANEEVAGLAADGHYVYVAVRRPAGLIILDHRNLRVVQRHGLPDLDDLHSLCVREHEVFLVSTGTNEVVRLQMHGSRIVSQSVLWRPAGRTCRADTHHLNGLCFLRGELHVSGFGERPGDDWSLAVDGFIRNLDRGETVASGVHHPHSLLPLDSGLAYCESGKRTVHLPAGPPIRGLPGYSRGLCRVGDHLLVGASARRLVSRSTGKIAPATGRSGPPDRCSVNRIALQSGSVDLMTDLTWHGGDIYDLLPLASQSCG